jgi:hypothetical protein
LHGSPSRHLCKNPFDPQIMPHSHHHGAKCCLLLVPSRSMTSTQRISTSPLPLLYHCPTSVNTRTFRHPPPYQRTRSFLPRLPELATSLGLGSERPFCGRTTVGFGLSAWWCGKQVGLGQSGNQRRNVASSPRIKSAAVFGRVYIKRRAVASRPTDDKLPFISGRKSCGAGTISASLSGVGTVVSHNSHPRKPPF